MLNFILVQMVLYYVVHEKCLLLHENVLNVYDPFLMSYPFCL